jgi:proteasome lid subunit RPN8/RPN11
MSGYGIELLNEDGAVVAGPADLFAMAAPFLHALIGSDISGLKLRFLIVPVISLDNDLAGDLHLAYRSERYGFIQVTLRSDGQVIYRHPHTVSEVVEAGVRAWLAIEPRHAEAAGYRLVGPDIVAGHERLTPSISGVTVVEPFAPGEKPAFRLRPLQPPPPPRRSIASFAAVTVDQLPPGTGGWTDQVSAVTDRRVQDALANQPYSSEVEEGGFLVGEAFEDAERPGSYLARIKAAVPAQQTGASFLHFTFTGDSFDHIKRLIDRDYPGQQLLGWYHTHLFPATSNFGLSSIDHRLHLSTFRLPWQVAGLINVDGKKRTLRFYGSEGPTMRQCGYHAAERDGE